eukprot:gnl/Spiro4/13187_TR6993_c0_g1_i1.p1 gnl/Spiro4/13187_TR6993_c0_g1~~gnl/Spiro4/13187_TR6993_c0_g1_i1.p1  ORF type:complete len:473 (-),score=79.97 gnl/Spiro4/13187_TR6993_c0_g1_i1:59-1477(-)
MAAASAGGILRELSSRSGGEAQELRSLELQSLQAFYDTAVLDITENSCLLKVSRPDMGPAREAAQQTGLALVPSFPEAVISIVMPAGYPTIEPPSVSIAEHPSNSDISDVLRRDFSSSVREFLVGRIGELCVSAVVEWMQQRWIDLFPSLQIATDPLPESIDVDYRLPCYVLDMKSSISLGNDAFFSADYPNALLFFNLNLKYRPTDVVLLSRKCITLIRMNRLADALAAANQIVALQPRNKLGYLRQALVYRMYRSHIHTIQALEAALAIDCNNVNIRRQLEGARFLSGVRGRHILGIPTELLSLILAWLSVETLCRLCEVCTELKERAEDNSLWQDLVQKKYGNLTKMVPEAWETARQWKLEYLFRSGGPCYRYYGNSSISFSKSSGSPSTKSQQPPICSMIRFSSAPVSDRDELKPSVPYEDSAVPRRKKKHTSPRPQYISPKEVVQKNKNHTLPLTRVRPQPPPPPPD